MDAPRYRLLLQCLALICVWTPSLLAQPHPAGTSWQYRLLDGTTLSDDCDICGRPTITYPVRGSFELVVNFESDTEGSYAVTNVDLTAGSPREPMYQIRGYGTYVRGGLPATQQMRLDLSFNGSTNRYVFTLATNVASPNREWPMLGISLAETQQVTLIQRFSLDLRAAPFREIWFLAPAGMTSLTPGHSNLFLPAGTLLSDVGRVIRSNATLIGGLGIMPPAPPLPLDALCPLPGGEIAFSLGSNIWSETLGELKHGDLLSERGRIVRNNASLIAAFQPQPPLADVGLDSAQFMPVGEVWFSIGTDIFSERLGITLAAGDLLSDSGRIVRTFKELTSRFQPVTTPPSGLDAFYAWPHGEIWFSTATGFQDVRLGIILPGDLLSDKGYVVFRNLELVGPLNPLEDLADFGLCGLFVVTDRAVASAAPMLLAPFLDSSGIQVQWNGEGRVFQVERSAAVTGPFSPASLLLPDRVWIEPASGNPLGILRVRQW